MDVAELIGRILPAIVAAVLEQGKGVIPADMLAGLQANVAGTVAALGGQATQLLQQTSTAMAAQANTALKQVGSAVPPAAQGVVEGAGKPVQGALQNVQKAAAGSLETAVPGAASQPAGGGKGVGQALEGLIKKGK